VTGPITAAMPNATTIVIAANKIFVFMAAALYETCYLKIITINSNSSILW
jgi:hypothetical protein